MLHLDQIWVFGWKTGNLSSSSTKELKFPVFQPNSRYWTRTKYPPFMKFKGVQEISRTITRYELILGVPSCRGVLFLSVKQHATTRWKTTMRKTNNGFLKIDESSHNFFLCYYRLVLTVGAIIYYDLAEDGIGPPRWPVELRDDVETTSWFASAACKNHEIRPLLHPEAPYYYYVHHRWLFGWLLFSCIVRIVLNACCSFRRTLRCFRSVVLRNRKNSVTSWYWMPTPRSVCRFVVGP